MLQGAYAVYHTDTKQIVIDTVHSTARGAMVNGLVVLYGQVVTTGWADYQIRQVWQEVTRGTDAIIALIALEFSEEFKEVDERRIITS
jgi:hypothetical protein